MSYTVFFSLNGFLLTIVFRYIPEIDTGLCCSFLGWKSMSYKTMCNQHEYDPPSQSSIGIWPWRPQAQAMEGM